MNNKINFIRNKIHEIFRVQAQGFPRRFYYGHVIHSDAESRLQTDKFAKSK